MASSVALFSFTASGWDKGTANVQRLNVGAEIACMSVANAGVSNILAEYEVRRK